MRELPGTARWVFALSSVDGTRAVNVLVHDSVERVRELFAIADAIRHDRMLRGGCGERGRPPDVSGSPSLAAPMARARAHIGELLVEYRIPSAQVGVLQAGTITDFAVGVRDVRTGEPASTDTIYQLGSMSKTWTAVAFLQLVDEGRVDLDEPVRTYLPGFRVADAEVSARLTARRLLNHTNGIEEAYGDPGEGDDVYARIVGTIADAPQVFGLGETHGYSAVLGYAILARIMETVEGRTWDEVMRRRVFDRLGLTSTSSRREDVDASRAAVGHILRPDAAGPVPSPIAYLPRAYGPGGNLSSTVRDVLAMAHIFLDEGRAPDGTSILSSAAVREMTTSLVAVPDPYPCGSHWGLGLTVSEWAGEPVYAHDGSTIGQNARLRIFPDRGLAIAMLTNGVPRDAFYRKAFTALLSELGAPTVPDLPQPDPSIRLDPLGVRGRLRAARRAVRGARHRQHAGADLRPGPVAGPHDRAARAHDVRAPAHQRDAVPDARP